MRFRPYLAPLAIITFGLFLRVYNLEKRVDFGFDQEVAAWWIKSFLVDHKISLIGQEISLGGIYIAPFFYYLLAPFYFLTQLYPLGGNIFITIVSFLTMAMIFAFAKQIFNKSCAMIAVFLYAIHPGIISYDITAAPSNMVMFLSVSTAFILTKQKRTIRDVVLLGIIFGATFSVHPTAILLIAISFFVFILEKQKPDFKKFLALVIPVIIFISPLIFFELRHHGLILHNIIFSQSLNSNDLFSMVNLMLVYWAGILVSSDQFFVKMPLFLLVTWIFFRTPGPILKSWLIIPLVFAVIYPHHIPEYYFLLTIPVMLIFTVGFLNREGFKRVVLFIIVVASVFMSLTQFKSIENKLSLFYKNQAVDYVVKQANNEPFMIYYDNDPGLNAGFRYLFWWHKAILAENSPRKFLIVVPASRQKDIPGATFGQVKIVTLAW